MWRGLCFWILRLADRIHQLIRVAYCNSADLRPMHTRQNTLFGYISLSPAFVPILGLLSPAPVHNRPLRSHLLNGSAFFEGIDWMLLNRDFGVCAICCGNTCHPVIAISVVPGPRDYSSCLDARSLTLPRYGLGVGRSATAETYVTKSQTPDFATLKIRGIELMLGFFIF